MKCMKHLQYVWFIYILHTICLPSRSDHLLHFNPMAEWLLSRCYFPLVFDTSVVRHQFVIDLQKNFSVNGNKIEHIQE